MNDFDVKLIASLVRNMVEAKTEDEVDMIYENIQSQLDLLYRSIVEKLSK